MQFKETGSEGEKGKVGKLFANESFPRNALTGCQQRSDKDIQLKYPTVVPGEGRLTFWWCPQGKLHPGDVESLWEIFIQPELLQSHSAF